jgi:ectoine hydroxylase-related dioxygenase (phytanoyl-CoA dioxygenase family)
MEQMMNHLVNEEAARHFRKHGWVRVPQLHDANQLQILLSVMEKGFANPPDINQTYGKAAPTTPKDVVSNDDEMTVLLNVRELNLYYDEVKPVCMDPRVGEVVKTLLGVPKVRLFSETYLNKPPGGASTPWHQDWPLQPFDRRETVNCWVALDNVTMDQGPLQVVSGSHRLGSLYMPTDFSDQPPLSDLLTEEDVDLLWSLAAPDDVNIEGVPVHSQAFSAGDALIFYGSALHGAPANGTKRHRRGYTRSIISADVRYTGMPYLKTDSVGLTPGKLFDLPRYPLFDA